MPRKITDIMIQVTAGLLHVEDDGECIWEDPVFVQSAMLTDATDKGFNMRDQSLRKKVVVTTRAIVEQMAEAQHHGEASGDTEG